LRIEACIEACALLRCVRPNDANAQVRPHVRTPLQTSWREDETRLSTGIVRHLWLKMPAKYWVSETFCAITRPINGFLSLMISDPVCVKSTAGFGERIR
jgi:hypothetical protein